MSIEVVLLLKSDLSDEKKCAYQEHLFGEVLQHYLECVVAGVKFFAATGNAVTKDRFGRCRGSRHRGTLHAMARPATVALPASAGLARRRESEHSARQEFRRNRQC